MGSCNTKSNFSQLTSLSSFKKYDHNIIIHDNNVMVLLITWFVIALKQDKIDKVKKITEIFKYMLRVNHLVLKQKSLINEMIMIRGMYINIEENDNLNDILMKIYENNNFNKKECHYFHILSSLFISY